MLKNLNGGRAVHNPVDNLTMRNDPGNLFLPLQPAVGIGTPETRGAMSADMAHFLCLLHPQSMSGAAGSCRKAGRFSVCPVVPTSRSSAHPLLGTSVGGNPKYTGVPL